MASITIHGPTTATLNLGEHRLLLGTSDAPAGDPDVVILGRACVEDAGRLPGMLRKHNRVRGKPTIVTPNAKYLGELLANDEVCKTSVNGKEMDISVESYAAVTEVPTAGGAMGVFKADGFGVFVDRCSWTRKDDALRTWIFRWDHNGPHAELIADALFKADGDAMQKVNDLEQAVTDELGEVHKRVTAGENVPKDQVPTPVLTRAVWAPYCLDAGEVFYHLIFTQRRMPYEPSGSQPRAAFTRCRFIEDLVGKEFHL